MSFLGEIKRRKIFQVAAVYADLVAFNGTYLGFVIDGKSCPVCHRLRVPG